MSTEDQKKKPAVPKPAKDGENKILDPKRAEPRPAPRPPMGSDARIDKTVEDSFPASDPPSYSPTTK